MTNLSRTEQLQKTQNEFLEEFMASPENAEWAKERRIEYLKNKKRRIIWIASTFYLKCLEFNLHKYTDFSKEFDEVARINKEIEHYTNPKFEEGITEAMIDNARNFPINQLIEIKNNWALCPFHNDKNPSAYCKNNYLHCFSCGETADTIKLYQHLFNCKFPEAIKALQ